MSKQVKVSGARILYPSLFTPKKNELNGQDEYSCVLLVPKTSTAIDAIKAAMNEVVAQKWGEKCPNGLRNPLKDGDEKVEQYGKAYEGMFFINAKSKSKPAVVDKYKAEVFDEAVVYGGCYVNAVLNAFAYDEKGNKGVSLYLQAVQFSHDGEPVGASTASALAMFDAEEEEKPAAAASNNTFF